MIRLLCCCNALFLIGFYGVCEFAGGGRRNKADFDTIEKAHYLPNSVLAFAPCHTSWHAVEYTESVRDTIQGFIKSEGSSMPKATCEIESENFRESSGEKVA